MRRTAILFMLPLMACGSEPAPRADAAGATEWDGPEVVSVDTTPSAEPVPLCDRLPDDGSCCSLACDVEALREQCGRPGVCLTYVCHATDGELFSVGVCVPPEPDGGTLDAATSDQCSGYWCPPADARWPEE